MDGAIHWINHYPVDKAIGLGTTYPLDSVKPVDSVIHRINHYPMDKAIGLGTTYPLDSDLYGG